MKKHTCLIFLTFFISNLSAHDIEGEWRGVLNVGAAKLRLNVNIAKEGMGYVATMDSPDQGAKGIPITKISVQDKTLEFNIDNLKASYKGVFSEDSIVGTFTQMNQNFSLDFSRNEIVLNRPQNPIQPYSYFSEDIKFHNKQADINLAGTFTYPKTGNQFPVAILISGSGAQNRDEELLEHKPFLVLSDYLTNRGIAVLRFDDRGVGESEGKFTESTTRDFATDVSAAIEYLKTRKEIDRHKIGLIGHSEGGLIAFQLGAKYPNDISFIVSMGGSGISGKELLRFQSKAVSLSGGASEEVAVQNQALTLKLIDYVEKYDKQYLKANKEELARSLLPLNMQTEESVKAMSNEITKVSSPWFREFLIYDPASDLSKIKSSVFALNGGRDVQVEADINLEAIERNLTNAKSKKIKKYPSLNHLFQTAKTGSVSEYQTIEETIAPVVLHDITDWIKNLYKL